MVKINSYINYPGNCEEAFNFYKSVFGGEFKELHRYKDMPNSAECSENDKTKLMHVSLPLDNETILMGSDVPESMMDKYVQGTNISLLIDVDSKEKADKYFNGLSGGGTILMPIQDTFWGAYHGMLADKFGIQWMISYVKPR
jgi:PhnB protein